VAINWSSARDINSQDLDETNLLTFFVDMRQCCVSRPSGNRDVETETTAEYIVHLAFLLSISAFVTLYYSSITVNYGVFFELLICGLWQGLVGKALLWNFY